MFYLHASNVHLMCDYWIPWNMDYVCSTRALLGIESRSTAKAIGTLHSDKFKV